MRRVLVTGADGFIGKNLSVALGRIKGVEVLRFDVADDPAILPTLLDQSDIIYHLAGVNRPQHEDEFCSGNAGLTRSIVKILTEGRKKIPFVLSSSAQAVLDNPYGISKREAEEAVFAYGRETGAPVYVFRLTNVFGKWSRPNYNSVVSTFCHNISHGLPIAISDPAREVELVYIDDVVAAFLSILEGKTHGSDTFMTVGPTCRITLGALAEMIGGFRDIRSTLVIPDFSDDFTRKLHATYLSFLETDDFSHVLDIRSDSRGGLAELIKSPHFGQMFVSRSHGGVIRGNHYHDTKIEKFCVLQGEAVIRFRHVLSKEVIEYRVSGTSWEVVDIPPGYTHAIENLFDGEMIVLFWANRIFDENHPDTHFQEV